MKKNLIISILVLITIVLCVVCIQYTMRDDGIPFIGEDFDIIKHAQQYNLFYSISLTNSLKPQCDFSDIEYNWEFPAETELSIYNASTKRIYLEDTSENEVTTYSTIQESIDDFYLQQTNIKDLSYDYTVSIYSQVESTYEKMPLFLNIDNFKIYTTDLGIWRDNEGKFAAGLYAVSNSYNTFYIDKNDEYINFQSIDETKTKKLIENKDIKFLNHELLCENSSIKKTSIDSIEKVYIYIDNYLYPVYKIIGRYNIEDNVINWTALLNPIDFTSLNYTSFIDSTLQVLFIPKPYIDTITLTDEKYLIEGYLSNKLKKDNAVYNADSIYINFFAQDETGEYVYGDRKEDMTQEINDSLKVNSDGKFSFSFSLDNFWKVEKMIYDNTNQEGKHSQENEIDRSIYDNWFQIIVCTNYQEDQLCSEKSRIYRLDR